MDETSREALEAALPEMDEEGRDNQPAVDTSKCTLRVKQPRGHVDT